MENSIKTLPLLVLLVSIGCQSRPVDSHTISLREQDAFLEDFKGKTAADVPSLLKDLSSAKPEIRAHAAHYLSHLGDAATPTIPTLIERLSDKDLQVRMAAVQSLGLLRATQSLPALKKLLASEPANRWMITQAIARIEGVPAS